MSHSIQTVYVVHHSHTDIGYTDLQERVIDTQVDYIRTAVRMMRDPANADFRWNCETLFCVEEFFKAASDEEKQAFARLVADGKIGISANYLNFNDLIDCDIYRSRLHEWQQCVPMKTAMMADINGISMGYRDAMLEEGIEFLHMNIHCHHGMYPLYQNQTAFRWENAQGKSMLVWNGEHYHLGNVLGIKPNHTPNFMTQNHLGAASQPPEAVDALHQNLDGYLTLCMVSLQELYAAIAPKLQDVPVLRGDLNDWWANGVGSTPYAVKHYRDAQRRFHLCERLDPNLREHYPQLVRTAEDHLMLYAEHTWGHSSTISNPCDTMVLNLDMRKTAYASSAHEAASRMLTHITREKGDLLRYYATNGTVRVCNPSRTAGLKVVDFYIESPRLARAEIRDEAGRVLPCQVSPHPRGRKITFTDTFLAGEEKAYTYRELPPLNETLNSRKCYVGAERIRDIVNDYDPVTYRLPEHYENTFFSLDYRLHEGVVSFVDKTTGTELLGSGCAPFFTPLYEVTPVHTGSDPSPCPQNEQRRLIGRNIRGVHASLYTGDLLEVRCKERGPIFTLLCLRYALPGTVQADVYIKLYEDLPRIDFTLQLGKTLSSDIESVFLPLSLNYPGRRYVVRKGGQEAFMPGVDQLPGSGMEYTMTDDGIAFLHEGGTALISTFDAPLVYAGEMAHHPIRLCENKPEDNLRPVYSWIMNNTWETNFKMDLSGFCEFQYSLSLDRNMTPDEAMDVLHEAGYSPYVLMIEQN